LANFGQRSQAQQGLQSQLKFALLWGMVLIIYQNMTWAIFIYFLGGGSGVMGDVI